MRSQKIDNFFMKKIDKVNNFKKTIKEQRQDLNNQMM